MKQEIKKWFTSRTIWINVLIIGAGIATGIAADLQTGGVITATGIINIILRVVTKASLK